MSDRRCSAAPSEEPNAVPIRLLLLLCGLAVWISPALAATGPICRVTTTGAGGADGSSWGQAMALQTALGTAACTELWVARGTYTPTIAAKPDFFARMARFNVRPGVAVYGGFAGNESARSERDFTASATLSGDIGALGNADDNSFQVVGMDGTNGAITASTVLDGFTIRDGNADSAIFVSSGAGFVCDGSGAGSDCSPSLSNIAFIQNKSLSRAGGMYNNGTNGGRSSPTLSNVTFSGNFASNAGGAMYNDGSDGGISSPILGNVTFSGNSGGLPQSSGNGGAMFNNGEGGGNSSPILVNVTMSGNSAGSSGGAMFNTGGFTGNLGTSSPILINVIVWNNPASAASGIYNYFQSTITVRSSMIEGGCLGGGQCTNLVAGDPQLGTLTDNGGSMQTLATSAASPAVNAGNDSDCSLSPVNGKDQRGAPRPQGSHCDIGAVEYFPGNYYGNVVFKNGLESP